MELDQIDQTKLNYIATSNYMVAGGSRQSSAYESLALRENH